MKGKLAFITIYTTAATLFASPMTAQAAVFTWEDAPLSGASENPPVNSPGTGFATVTLDTVAQTLSVNVTFSGLTSGTTASHIHCCTTTRGGNAGVATTTPTFAGFPLGVTFGTFVTTLDMTQMSSYNPAFITANGGTVASAEAVLFAGMEDGDSYLNIHTSNNPGGEIRALLTPLPATLPLFASGLVGLGLLGWRRKRKAASA